jgi:uncharacterized DUF497 family protein
MDVARFEWDPLEDLENLAKHGVSFHEAQGAFSDERRVIAQDIEQSEAEPRYVCIGRVERGIVTVRFTWRRDNVRIFGAGFWRMGKVIHERQGSLHR